MDPQRDSLVDYYSRRAPVYEEIFERDDPVRQTEQADLTSAMQRALSGRAILELACGTGYWTERVAPVAKSVRATDASAEMLGQPKAKAFDSGKVEFELADAYQCAGIQGRFDGGLANFWLSHVPRSRLSQFLAQFHQRLEPGAVVFMADNLFVPTVGGELITIPGCEDTFKRRALPDGSHHDILKNYLTSSELRSLLMPWAYDLQVDQGHCFWWLTYRLE